MLRHRLTSLLPRRLSVAKTTTGRRLKFEGLESRTMFTAASAAGDFNGDGRDDLAIGLPGESIGALEEAGEVRVRYGAQLRLDELNEQLWTLDSPGVNGDARAGDGFGSSLAVGDFNNDGYEDLAIGIPGRIISGQGAAGAVTILFGSRHGLRAIGDQQWSQDSLGVNGHARANENFGTALATGDFDNNGYDDLAIGTPGESTAGVAQAGVVNVIFGSRSGLKRSQDQLFRHRDQFWFDAPNHRTDSKSFGSVLAAGDFNNDGYDDLAISMREQVSVLTPPPDPVERPLAGGVDIYRGAEYGLEIAVADNLTGSGKLAPAGLLDPDADEYFFGAALAVGDFDRDGFYDLAIGSPGELTEVVTVAGNPPAEYVGVVYVIYGSESGIGSREQTLTPRDFELYDNQVAHTDEGFGRALAAGNFDTAQPQLTDDLAIGMAFATVNGQIRAGKVAVVHHRSFGQFSVDWSNLTSKPISFDASGSLVGMKYVWHQDQLAILDSADANDFFGASLVAGDFDGNGNSDLAIGVPGENGAGATAILYGSPMDLFITGAVLPPEYRTPAAGLKRWGNQLWLHAPSTIIRD
jgi:hypothetical protein